MKTPSSTWMKIWESQSTFCKTSTFKMSPLNIHSHWTKMKSWRVITCSWTTTPLASKAFTITTCPWTLFIPMLLARKIQSIKYLSFVSREVEHKLPEVMITSIRSSILNTQGEKNCSTYPLHSIKTTENSSSVMPTCLLKTWSTL